MVFLERDRNSARDKERERETKEETEISGEHDNIFENLRVFFLFL